MKNAIFIHIPKTGGSTLQGIINRQYKKSEVFHIKNNRIANDFDKLPIEAKKTIKILKGHMAYGHHKSFLHPNDVTYFTLLRNPVSRIFSLYHFILKQKKHHTHKAIISNNYNLKGFIESGINLNTNNCHVRLLANRIDTPFHQCTRDMLEEAKKNLEERFVVVGFTEEFDSSILLLKNEFGWKNPYYRIANVTGYKNSITDLDTETLDTIRHYNSLDIELYDWAKERFDEKVATLGPKFQKQLHFFQSKNSIVQKILSVKDKLILR